MTRTRTLLAICALAVPVSALLAGCGGDDGGDDSEPRTVLERTASTATEVNSGVIDVAIAFEARGEQGGSFSAGFAGPFQADPEDPRAFPRLDLGGSISGSGAGESIDETLRLIVTEDNAFIDYDGDTYEAGTDAFDAFGEDFDDVEVDEDTSFRELCEDLVEQRGGGNAAACDIDVADDWLTNLENEGTEDVEGTETVHVSGDLDVARVITDVSSIVGSARGLDLEGFDPSQLAPAIPEATFDLFSATEDDTLRRLDFRIVVDPSALLGGLITVPIEDIAFDFSLTVSELNEPQTIEAPSGPTIPLDELFEGLGDLEGIGPDGDLGGGGLPELGGPEEDLEGSGGGGGSEVSPEEAQQYLECIQDAAGDPEAINACAAEL